MCGITGYIHFDKNRTVSSEKIKRMSDVIAHRGPDGEGFYCKNNLALGHRRLSIIDLKTGDQPIFNDDKTIAIIFNGEIYNYIELREELKTHGKVFHTDSDTEVIIKAYEKWGLEFQSKLNGMWAFALWDEKKQTLLLSRDRMGEKPMFYSVYDNTLVFGSEIKCLFSYGIPVEKRFDLIEMYLNLSYIPAPDTFYKNIFKLHPANYLVVKDGKVEEHSYWELPDINEKDMLTDREVIHKNFEELFDDSVRIRMRSDVPFGAFLSGGLDSASIVSSMAKISSYPVQTFTIGFDDKHFDERGLAKEVAEKFKTDHNEYLVSPDSFDEALQKVIDHYDEPFGDPSAIPTGYVSRAARQKVKMVLTGDGGDEVLSGYTAYQGTKFSDKYKSYPSFVRTGLPSFIKVISKPVSGNMRYKANRVVNVLESSNMDFLERTIYKSLPSGLDLKNLLEPLSTTQKSITDFYKEFLSKCRFKDDFYKLMFLQLKSSLPDDMLTKVDRMSMAYSLETRVPFLDYRIVELLYRVHKDIKMEGYERKSVLRNTVAKRLPQSLLNAPKKGFSVPLRQWFKGSGFDSYLASLSQNSKDVFHNSYLNSILEKNKNAEGDYGNFIWSLFVLKKFL
ncbi:MAG: asparagine synthase (glutamine-hydrolyzing) [Ignavibacteriales bacterium]|nr:MAG: asparagine synthase (glutamine-hydrolyzing) [Ignavibacteriales bacterium]